MEYKNIKNDLRYLKLLQRDFPDIASVSTEIINLKAILHLPKPTEHFLADLHGENEAFQHVLRNASGNIRRKVEENYADVLSAEEISELCTLIYYPEEKLRLMREALPKSEHHAYYLRQLEYLIPVCRSVSHKYTRSKVRKALPSEFGYIIEELLHESVGDPDKQRYYNVILQTIVETHRGRPFIIQLCQLIQRLAIDRLHILGDMFDRGPAAHKIMDTLMVFHNIDIVWGNHDVLWMGAAAGNPACIAAVVRLSLRYANTSVLEDGYGINLRPLATFAMEYYAADSCELFRPSNKGGSSRLSSKEQRVLAQMHKAITVIQWKLEAQLYHAHPEWNMEDRALIEHIHGIHVNIEGCDYELRDAFFPTLTQETCNSELTREEANLVRGLVHSFTHSERLQQHVEFLLQYGHMFNVSNGNLLFHASVPLNEDGSLKQVNVCGQTVCGRDLMTRVDQILRQAFDDVSDDVERQQARDYYWYVWCGADSPLFDKSKMATFERYLVADVATHVELKGHYYTLRDSAEVLDNLMDAFGVTGSRRHIINGHVPVRAGEGESPIKGDGRLMVIDGGFSKAYHHQTGIAGYTLVYHSRGFELVQHAPFVSTEEAIRTGADIQSTTHIVEMADHRERVADTDKGQVIRTQIADLKNLLTAYRKGIL